MSQETEYSRTYTIHNCHVHLFTIDYIPRNFLSRWFPVTLAKKKWIANLAYKLLKNRLNRYSAFFYSSLKKSHEDVLEELSAYYPRSAKFVPLSVDFDYMQAGDPIHPFEKQLKDLAQLKEKYPDKIYPFIGVDPRREDIAALVKEYIEDRGFSGIKLYPALGFFPDDDRLDPVYEYAQEYQIPITTHCIPKNQNHYRGKITDEMKEKASEIPGYSKRQARRAYDFAMYLNHPYWYYKVVNRYPGLKINLAHFGGNEEWDRYLDEPYRPPEELQQRARSLGEEEKRVEIPDGGRWATMSWYSWIRELIKQAENVYADISFTVYDDRLYPVLKNLVKSTNVKNRILFGSDFYMLQKDYRERRFGIDVRGYLDDEDYWLIAEDNPRRFLTNTIRNGY
ncbi:MAG: amidohydrolase family protein [Saprospiraceae bacterium]|nr:amidohydrolase family protein [Saprospiraceae bacterium]